MTEDYYKTLGVKRDASQAEIQKAYRDLARKHHPDLNPDDKTAKERFQQVQAAFDVLNDPGKRELYDRYGSSFEQMGAGGPRGPGGPRPSGGWSYTASSPEDFDFSQFFGERFGGEDPNGGFADIFSQFRRARSAGPQGRAQAPPAQRGSDVHSELSVPFQTAIAGGTVNLQLHRPDGRVETIAVKIPAGIENGKKIRLRGQGEPGPDGQSPGDLLIAVHIDEHPHFHRRGRNLYVKVPVTLAEATLGGKVDVPTPRGTVTIRIPAGTSSGTRLRVKGRGIESSGQTPGDLFAEVQIVLPKEIDEDEQKWFEKFQERHPADPRKDLRW